MCIELFEIVRNNNPNKRELKVYICLRRGRIGGGIKAVRVLLG